jgi:hypothetical protein
VAHTFDCPNLYYHQELDTIKFIKMTKEIDWSKITYQWTKMGADWNNSSTLKINTSRGFVPIVEFQFHSTSRTNMAVRWCYDNVLDIFRDNFTVELL